MRYDEESLNIDINDILLLNEQGSLVQIIPLEKTNKLPLMFYMLEKRLKNGASHPGGMNRGHTIVYHNYESNFLKLFPQEEQSVKRVYNEYVKKVNTNRRIERQNREIIMRQEAEDRIADKEAEDRMVNIKAEDLAINSNKRFKNCD